MAIYILRAAQSTAAVNVYTNLVNDGTGTNVGAVTVPAGQSTIAQIIFAYAMSTLTTTSVGGTVHLRLTGTGLAEGQQELTVGGWTSLTTTSGSVDFDAHQIIATDIRVIPTNTITLAAAMSGVDTGTQEYSCTLVFQA